MLRINLDSRFHGNDMCIMFKPLFNKVLVEPIEEEKQTESGIVLPDSVKDSNLVKGKVVVVGPGRKNRKGEMEPVVVKEGDKVVFTSYSGEKIKEGEKDYYVISDKKILGIIE